ncbi:hypothetical protein FKO01_49615 [Mesorhizobium sp. B2-3-3]|nr:hypothetical protein FKO01_49615 [Mesorhizobium sp. B2-3-3]
MPSKCWACQSDLADGQIFCNECKNWQGWRKYFNISTLTFSLIIAFVSVLGAVGPEIKLLFFPGSPNLSVAGSYITGQVKKGGAYFGDYTLQISATNTGEVTTSLRPNLICKNVSDSQRLLAFDAISPTIVEAAKSTIVRYKRRFIEFHKGPPTDVQISTTGTYKCDVALHPPSKVIIVNHNDNTAAEQLNFAIISINSIDPDCTIETLTEATLQKCSENITAQ